MTGPRRTWDAAVVLAGGTSSRMGRDKALLTAPDGTTLLGRALRMLAPRFGEIAVSVGAAGPGAGIEDAVRRAEAELGRTIAVIRDRLEDAGPLAALAASLEEIDSPLALFHPVDAPGISFDLAGALREEASAPGANGSMARWSRGLEPARGVYCKCLFPAVVKLLEAGERSLQAAASLPGVSIIDLDGDRVRRRIFGPSPPDLEALFRNLNTPEEYSAWLRSGTMRP